MSGRRWAGWMLFGCAVLGLFWLCALLGGWSPQIARLTVDVHGFSLASYRADSAVLAPLSSQVIADAGQDQSAVAGPKSTPDPRGSGSPSPSATSSVSPSGPGPSPTLPIPSLPSPSLPVKTPTPPPTPTLPITTPSVPPTPPLP